MATMYGTNSAPSLAGFYVSQPSFGAALQFQPALGTRELDEMMDAYLPGDASIKDKRTTISLDFFEYKQLTGQSIKFYPVPVYAFTSTTNSPASTQDSGYSSSFSVSPIAPTWSWPSSSRRSSSHQSSSKARTVPATSSRQVSSDFSHIPGMKILTKDGRDVTNSASRGCKTREQRDHAHLMRIIKACDSCRRKKIRCDPSHKPDAPSRTQAQPLSRPAKKTKVVAVEARSQVAGLLTDPLLIAPSLADQSYVPEFETSEPIQESWDEFIQYDQETAFALPHEYDFFADPNGYLSPPAQSSASSPLSWAAAGGQEAVVKLLLATGQVDADSKDSTYGQTPLSFAAERGHEALLFTPTSPVASPESQTSIMDVYQPPTLPYLDSNMPAHHYVDFNLYSPASSFADEEPNLLRREPRLTEIRAEALDMDHDVSRSHQAQTRPFKGDIRFLNNPGVIHGREAEASWDDRNTQGHPNRLVLDRIDQQAPCDVEPQRRSSDSVSDSRVDLGTVLASIPPTSIPAASIPAASSMPSVSFIPAVSSILAASPTSHVLSNPQPTGVTRDPPSSTMSLVRCSCRVTTSQGISGMLYPTTPAIQVGGAGLCCDTAVYVSLPGRDIYDMVNGVLSVAVAIPILATAILLASFIKLVLLPVPNLPMKGDPLDFQPGLASLVLACIYLRQYVAGSVSHSTDRHETTYQLSPPLMSTVSKTIQHVSRRVGRVLGTVKCQVACRIFSAYGRRKGSAIRRDRID